ncbi:hypothetical protein [Shewanella phage FishSpeaker]|nr:hypothetical protein [Shewanella phage FishSpeaker]
MIVDHNACLSKGARLIRGLSLGDHVENKVVCHIDERFLSHFQEIAEELLKERLPVNIGVPYCFYVLSKGMEDSRCTWQRDEFFDLCKEQFESRCKNLDAFLTSPILQDRYKKVFKDLMDKLETIIKNVKAKKSL